MREMCLNSSCAFLNTLGGVPEISVPTFRRREAEDYMFFMETRARRGTTVGCSRMWLARAEGINSKITYL